LKKLAEIDRIDKQMLLDCANRFS